AAPEGEDGRRCDQGEEAAAIDDGGRRVRSHSSTLMFASRAAAEGPNSPDVSAVVTNSPAKPRRVSMARPPSPSRPLRREGARAHPRVSFCSSEATAGWALGQPPRAGHATGRILRRLRASVGLFAFALL